MRFGTVALFGRSNVGKSTFLNAALGERLAIVSPLPQTTRDALLGVVNRDDAQIAFIDTPGLHRPRSELGRRMNATAVDAARSADLMVFVTDVEPGAKNPEALVARDRDVLGLLPPDAPALCVINKVDLVRDKRRLLPMLAAYRELRDFVECIPVSVTRKDGVDTLLAAIAAHLPEGPASFDADYLTNRPTAFFVREYIREQVLASARREVPHAVAVSVEAFEQGARALVIKATIHVEKPGQQRILVGKGGQQIREIGTRARERIEELLGKHVHLELFVRVNPRWKDVPRQLAELGYQAENASDLDVLPSDSRRRRGKAG